jgi:hypothetical protein
VVEVGIDVAERLLVLRPKSQDFVLALRLFALLSSAELVSVASSRKSNDLARIVGRAFFQGV